MQMSSDAAAFPRETDASPSPGAFVRGTNVALKEGLCQCLRLVSRGVAGFVSGRLALGLGARSSPAARPLSRNVLHCGRNH